MNPVVIVLLIVLGVLVLFFLIASFLLWRIACSRNDATEKHFETVLSSPSERVRVNVPVLTALPFTETT